MNNFPHKKTIVVEVEKLHNLNSGLGQFCKGLCDKLIKYASDEFNLHFLLKDKQQGILGANTNYQVIPGFLSRLGSGKIHANLWHCTHQQSAYLPSSNQCKMLLTVHDLNFLYKYSGWKRRLYLFQLQRRINRADVVVAISTFTANSLKTHTKIDEKKIRIIPNGVNFPPDNTWLMATLPEEIKSKKYLFGIGIINAKKNFHVVLPLLKHHPTLYLVLAGNCKDSYIDFMKQEAKKSGVSDRLIFTGEVSEPVKHALYYHCYAFVFPSLAEGFGIPVIEAMYHGKPVFLSNRTCLPEIGGTDAFYWADFSEETILRVFDEGMNMFFNDGEKIQRQKNYALQFSWERAAKLYLEEYRRLLSQ